jgi:hypothetical protein
MADKEAERIKFETELLKLIVLLAAAMGGGSVGLLLGETTSLRLGLAGVGLLGTLILAIGGWQKYRYIQMLIEQIQEVTR